MDRLAIVVTQDSYDKLLCPFVFAYLQSLEGTQVDIFFASWAIKALTEEGARNIKIEGHHADQDQMVRKRVAELGLPAEVHEFLKTLTESGFVNLHGCDMAANIYGVSNEDLIEEASGIISATHFLHEIAVKAEHCQYF